MGKTVKNPVLQAAKQIKATDLVRFVPVKAIEDQFGRPNVITLQVLQDLKYAFLLDCPAKEAANYAGIAEKTYYNFVNAMTDDLKTDFLQLVDGWRNDTILTARKTLRVAASKAEHAKWILERRRKDEFAPRTQQEIKQVSEFDDLTDEELEKLANAGSYPTKGADSPSETEK